MAVQFKKASKLDAKLRLMLCGPAGSGKTYTSSIIARELASGGKVAFVDTEHGSASKYADIFDFDCIAPDVFDPFELMSAIDTAVSAGYSVLIIDSLSHYWAGPGGELEMVDNAAARSKGNSFSAWKSVTPVHNQLVDKIIGCKIHIIATLRSKTEWVIDKDERTGKSTPRKIGLTPIFREGSEFLFDVCGDLDQENTLTVTKSRCPELSNKVIQRPGITMAQTLKAWLVGAPPAAASLPAATLTSQPAASPSVTQAPQQATSQGEQPSPHDNKFAEMIAKFQEQKARIGEAAYYETLKAHGVEKSNQFHSFEKARECWSAMAKLPAVTA